LKLTSYFGAKLRSTLLAFVRKIKVTNKLDIFPANVKIKEKNIYKVSLTLFKAEEVK